MSCSQQVEEDEVVQKEEQDCGGEPVALEDGGRDVRLDLSSIVQVVPKDASPSAAGNDGRLDLSGTDQVVNEVRLDLSSISQVLPNHPVPLVSSLRQTYGGGPMLHSTPPLHRMHFPLTKSRNQAFLDAQQWAVAFAVFASSNPSQVELRHKFTYLHLLHVYSAPWRVSAVLQGWRTQRATICKMATEIGKRCGPVRICSCRLTSGAKMRS